MDGSELVTVAGIDATRADLHCHSTASQESRLGVQRSWEPSMQRLAAGYDAAMGVAGAEADDRAA